MFRGQGNDGFEIEAGKEGHLRRSGTGGAVDAWLDYGEEGGDLDEGLGGGLFAMAVGGVCMYGEVMIYMAPLDTHRDRDSERERRVFRGGAAPAGPRSSAGRGCVPRSLFACCLFALRPLFLSSL